MLQVPVVQYFLNYFVTKRLAKQINLHYFEKKGFFLNKECFCKICVELHAYRQSIIFK